MDNMILTLSLVVFGQAYTDLLAIDLLDYSDKEKQQALYELKQDVQTMHLALEQRNWLISCTTC